MKRIIFLAGVLCFAIGVYGQFILNTTSYSQDFNSLSNVSGTSVMPTGWQFGEAGPSANSTYSAGTGSSSTGDTYSFGPSGSTERALGGLRSASLAPVFGFYFINNTGNTIINISISYKGETWRVGGTNREDLLNFQYSNTAIIVTTGSWLDHNGLDYANHAQATTGSGTVQDSAIITSQIIGLTIPDNTSFFIRWTDSDVTGSDDGMGIDNFSMNVTIAIPTPVMLFDFGGNQQNKANVLNWKTLTESNNSGFEIQSSHNGLDFMPIGFVSSKAIGGNSTIELNYSFTDDNSGNRHYYRLKQFDLDNGFSFSKTIYVKPVKSVTVTLSNLFPNPAHNIINLVIDSYRRDNISLVITDQSGRILIQTNKVLINGLNTRTIDISQLAKGSYYLRLINDGYETITRKFIIQ